MRLVKLLSIATFFTMLSACGPSIDDARKLGFGSVEEMEDLQAKGYKTKKDFLDHLEKMGLAWIAKQKNFCVDYKDAPNEIKKSNIFNQTMALVSKSSVPNGVGILRKITTSQGGDRLQIEVLVEGQFLFRTSPLHSTIVRGSKVYKQVENLTEGSCVVFSAFGIESASVFEESKVCDLEYRAKFRNVEPC